MLIAAAVLTAFLVWASADIGSGVYVRALCRRRTGKAVVALTFDDGPDPVTTPEVLDVLRRHGVKAAFFVTGEKLRRNPETARRTVAEGHILGNHTYRHSAFFPLMSGRGVAEEIEKTQIAAEEIAGVRPLLFRPPFGVTNPIIGGAVSRAGLRCIGWSIRSLDTFENRSREEVCRRIADRLHNGAVILLHDRCKDAGRLTEMVISAVENEGFDIVPLDELFDMDVYEKRS